VTGLSLAELQGNFVGETFLVSCTIGSSNHPNLSRQTLAEEIDMTLWHPKGPITLLLVGLLAHANPQSAEAAEALTREAQAAITPDKALAMLKQGNERFVGGTLTNRDYAAQVKQPARGQFPFAAIISCLDSRVPPAIVFDRGTGDLFVARVAGNFVNDDTLGSLEFATKLAGAKLIVVMGHTEYGAIKGACDGAQLGLLTATLANINPAVNAVAGNYTPRSSANAAFVEAVAEMNVKLTMQKLRDRSLVLGEMIDKGQIGPVGAMYNLTTGKVEFYE
jgi:carbonic anhydrase